MKIAIIGSSGYIGKYLLKKIKNEKTIEEVITIDKTSEADNYLDLNEAEKFNYEILNCIDLIVFTAAISGPDLCADQFNVCWKINVIGTQYFIKEAIKRNCRVLFFSSDAVFGDKPNAIYNEDSETNAASAYGKMKKAVEDKFKSEKLFKAIRLSYVASAKDRFYTYCNNCMKNNECANIYHPFYRNVIVVSDVVDVVVFFVNHWQEYKHMFLNVAGFELVSRVRMADEFNRINEGKLKYKITMPEKTFFRNRPQITHMKSLYIQKYGILRNENFTEKITRELEGLQ